MLKFTNQQKTEARFFSSFFSLAAPEDWDSIGDGPTKEKVKAWLAAGNLPIAADPEPAPIDQGDLDQIQKQLKALALVMAQWNGKTVPQLKAAFRAAMDSLP